MAPEYVVTGEVSPAADVYGLALTLYEMATGTVYGQPKVRRTGMSVGWTSGWRACPRLCPPRALASRDAGLGSRAAPRSGSRRSASAERSGPDAGTRTPAVGSTGRWGAARSAFPMLQGSWGGRSPWDLPSRNLPLRLADKRRSRLLPQSLLLARSPSRGTASPPQFLASHSRPAPPSRPARGTQTRDESRETGYSGPTAAPLRPVPAVGPHPRPAPGLLPRGHPHSSPPPSSPPPAAPAPRGPLSGPPRASRRPSSPVLPLVPSLDWLSWARSSPSW